MKWREEKKIKAKSHYVHFRKYANDGIGKKSDEPDLERGRREEEGWEGGVEENERKINMQIYSFNQNLNML